VPEEVDEDVDEARLLADSLAALKQFYYMCIVVTSGFTYITEPS
jgi:hypothetical protein